MPTCLYTDFLTFFELVAGMYSNEKLISNIAYILCYIINMHNK